MYLVEITRTETFFIEINESDQHKAESTARDKIDSGNVQAEESDIQTVSYKV